MVTANLATVAIDNGGGTIKAGVVGRDQSPSIVPNCSARHKGERQLFIGDMVASCPDVLSFIIRRPVDRGYTVSFDFQRDIWMRVLKTVLKVNPANARVCMTEPLFNLPALHEATLKVLFEDLGVGAVFLESPAFFALHRHAQRHPELQANVAGCGMVVDAGFSFSHAVPMFEFKVLEKAVKRIDIGGKALTNHMKTLVSYRSVNMMAEGYLMDHIKEQLCFVSQDIAQDLAASKGRNSMHKRVFILPDGVHSRLGHVLDEEAGEKPPHQKEMSLIVNNERFMVPEVLFHPSDIGLAEAGLAEAIARAVQSAHPALHGLLYSNIVLVGGTTALPGFRERLLTELRPLVPDAYEVNIYQAGDPISCAWEGQMLVADDPAFQSRWLTRAEYGKQAAQSSLATTDLRRHVAAEPSLEHMWDSDQDHESAAVDDVYRD